MKVTALGVHSAFAVGQVVTIPETDSTPARGKKLYEPKFQSNFLLEFATENPERPFRFMLDFGSDIRHSLMYSANLDVGSIDAWYCSHPHADHMGGIENISLMTFFNPVWRAHKKMWLEQNGWPNKAITDVLMLGGKMPESSKPQMWAHKEVIRELWAPGMATLQGLMEVNLKTYFNVIPMNSNIAKKIQDGDREWKVYTIESTHVVSGTSSMPSFGLMFECSDGKRVYFPTDTLFVVPPTMQSFYQMADVIYQDCETGFKSGVHSHITDIERAPDEIKKKLYLYHYSEEPKVQPGEYRGVLTTGEVHEY
jgi:ribonuclease BN (tRNA processing enzyme)